MKVNIETIEHADQRYPTCGDWYVDDVGIWQIRVSKMSDWRYEFLVALHELVEMAWCQWKGVPEPDVAEFDKKYEAARAPAGGGDTSEPGDSPDAPYYWGHQAATVIERGAALALGVNWQEYSAAVANL